MSPESPPSSDAKVKILLAAERLFAEHGLANVSLREIGAAAGQKNNSAVQYHFTDKQTLVIALYNYRLEPLNQRRLAMLAAREHHTIPQLVEAFIRPLGTSVIESGGSNAYARFIARYLSEGAGDHEPFETHHTSGVAAILDQLDTRLTQSQPVRQERIRQVMHLVPSVLADLERRLENSETTRAGAIAAVEGLITGTTAFLMAA